MPVLNKDIIIQAAATMPENDTTTTIGGARDVDSKMTFSDMSATDQLTCKSTSGSDITTFNITVTGKNDAGTIVSHVVTLAGTTGVDTPTGTTNTIAKIMKIQQTAGAALNGTVGVYRKTAETGTGSTAQGGANSATEGPYIDLQTTASVTEDLYNRFVIVLTGGTGSGQIREILKYNGTGVATNYRAFVNEDWATVPDGTTTYTVHTGALLDKNGQITLVRRLFYDAAAEAVSGSQKIIYESVHVYNRHATKALTNCTLTELTTGTVDDNVSYAIISGALDTSSTNGANNRVTIGTWSGEVFKDSGDGAVTISNSGSLDPLKAQQLVMRLTLAAGEAPDNDVYPLQVDGQSD